MSSDTPMMVSGLEDQKSCDAKSDSKEEDKRDGKRKNLQPNLASGHPKRRKRNQRQRIGTQPRRGDVISVPPPYITFEAKDSTKWRHVKPYDHEFRCFAKGRWLGKGLLDNFSKEFLRYSHEYYKKAIQCGLITVRDEEVGIDYIIKDGDWITHKTHWHEAPILADMPKILFESEDLLVINKPSSIPVHPCGRYRYNTLQYLIKIMRPDLYSTQNLKPAFRLDRVTSGLLIMAKNSETSKILYGYIAGRRIEKQYLARVNGVFPEGEVMVERPIHCIDHRKGQYGIHEDGKEAVSFFELVRTNGTESIVLCRPKTGRTHQLRIHLSYLKFPITNDSLYGGKVFKKSHPDPAGDDNKGTLVASLQEAYQSTCHDCDRFLREARGEEPAYRSAQMIYLHAYRYKTDDGAYDFTCPKPKWANI